MTEVLNKNKLLFIEDDEFMIDLLVKGLADGGLEIAVAKTGAEGLQKFKEIKPALVILDILLPDKDGFEVLREIRRLPEGRDTKVAVLSNLGETPAREEAKRLGVDEYLVKINYSLAEIVEKIKSLLKTF